MFQNVSETSAFDDRYFRPQKKIKMTNNNNVFHLIKGQFSPLEAREVLLSLINYKIEYHELKMLSNLARGSELSVSTMQRIDELKNSRREIIEVTDMYADLDGQLELEAEVVLNLVIKKPMLS
jgi:hypothetical protein